MQRYPLCWMGNRHEWLPSWPCHLACTLTVPCIWWVLFDRYVGLGEHWGLSWWCRSWTCCKWCWRSWGSSLQHHYVLDLGCGARGNCLRQLHLRGDFEGSIALGQRQCTRTGLRMDLIKVAGGLLCLAPWNDCCDCQSLPLGKWSSSCQCGWWGYGLLLCSLAVSTSRSQKVTLLVVFLIPLGVGEVGLVRSSNWEVGTLEYYDP